MARDSRVADPWTHRTVPEVGDGESATETLLEDHAPEVDRDLDQELR